MGGTGQPVPPIVVETKMVLLIARYEGTTHNRHQCIDGKLLY